MTTLRRELAIISRLSIPVALSQLGLMAMGVVDTVMVGRLGVSQLGASALGNAWQWTWLSFGMGLVIGIDPLISQAHGKGDGPSTALALQRGVVLALLVSVPIALAMAFTREGLLLLGQEPEVAALAHRYNLLKLPTVPCFLTYTAVRQWLQGRTLMAPATWVIWIANVVHVLLNWALIFGRLGMPALGIEGAAIASSLSMLLLMLGLVAWVRVFRLHAGAWRPWDRSCLDRAGLLQAARLGIPVGLSLGFEACAFTTSTLMAGWLGREALAGHQIVLNLASLSFMVPLGVSQGAATRVGNLIGARDQPGMRRAVQAALLLGAAVMSFSAGMFVLLRFQLPLLYTDARVVMLMAAEVLPLAAAFQLSDGTQVVSGGVLRGMGRPDAGAIVNLVGYYAVALPLAYVLAFMQARGLIGIWFALALGLTLVATSLVFWAAIVSRRPLAALSVVATAGEQGQRAL